MDHIFKLHIKPNVSTLMLLKQGVVFDEVTWAEGRDMGRQLFAAISELLKKNNLKPEAISDFILQSEIPDVYTSTRIAETVKRVYTFGVSAKGKIKNEG